MSESNKFTPGPWLYRGKSNSVHESCRTHPFGHTIFVFDDDAPLRDPDLSLILAAPDLLEALENLLWHAEYLEELIESERGRGRNADQLYADGEMHNYMVEAKASISKARGNQ